MRLTAARRTRLLLTLLLLVTGLIPAAGLPVQAQPPVSVPGEVPAGDATSLKSLKAIYDRGDRGIDAPTAPLVPRAAPPNDLLVNAFVATLPYTRTIEAIQDATNEPGKIPFCGGRNQDVWFTFTLDTPRTLDISLPGSTYDTAMTLYSGPAGATSAQDLVFLNCNDDIQAGNVYIWSALYRQTLDAGTYYVQVSDYGQSPAGGSAVLNIEIKDSGAPTPFSYLSPLPADYATGPRYYAWSAAPGATVYEFTMNLNNEELTPVFTLTGLTPEADSDGLACNSDCLLEISPVDAALIIDGQQYKWTVQAKNADGVAEAVNTTEINKFDTDFKDLPTPFFVYDFPAVVDVAPLVYRWTYSPDALVYDLVLQDFTGGVPGATIIELLDQTPAADGDTLNCTYAICTQTLSEAQAAQLVDGHVYLWYVRGRNSAGTTLSTESLLTLDATPLPFDFSLYTSELLNDPADLYELTWQPSTYATAYDLTVQVFNPDETPIIEADGLTPAVDADPLTCDASLCAYALSDSSRSLIADGTYSLYVTATNAHGATESSESGEVFTIDSLFAYYLQTPPDDTTFSTGDELTGFSWQALTSPDTTLLFYNLNLGQTYGATYPGNIRFLTPDADNDVLTCADNICTVTATGSQLNLRRNHYQWSVKVNFLYGSDDFFLKNAGLENDLIIGAVPDALTLRNGSFEALTTPKLPDNWKVKGDIQGSRVKCNKPDKTFGYVGTCAWQAKSSPGGKLVQTLNATGLLPGDTLTLSGYLAGKNIPDDNARVKLRVKYSDDTRDKLQWVAATTEGYVPYTGDLVLTGVPAKLQVVILNRSAAGKLRVDGLALDVTLAEDAVAPLPLPGLIPLPVNPESGLGGRGEVLPVPDSHLGGRGD